MHREQLPPMTFNKYEIEGQGLNFYFRELDSYSISTRVNLTQQPNMIMLGGYSYLGLNGHPEINQAVHNSLERFGSGGNGSPILAGTTQLHNELEREICSLVRAEACLLFTSGYVANASVLSSLLGKDDTIISDRLNHASIVDGAQFSQATVRRYPHNDMERLERMLRSCQSRSGRALVVTDGVFSMDGDIADIPAISRLCRKYGAWLMVDEAHSIGVLGETGGGVLEHFGLSDDAIDIKMGTLSKAIPSSGAYLAGSQDFIDWCKWSCRGYIFSGALQPPAVAAALAGIRLLRRQPQLVESLRENAAHFAGRLRKGGLAVRFHGTPIIPIPCGDAETAGFMAHACIRAGIFIQAVLPPAVPAASALLRASVMATHTKSQLDDCADAILEAAAECGLVVHSARTSGPLCAVA